MPKKSKKDKKDAKDPLTTSEPASVSTPWDGLTLDELQKARDEQTRKLEELRTNRNYYVHERVGNMCIALATRTRCSSSLIL